MPNKLKEVNERYFEALIKELDDKNIRGVRFVKRDNKLMLLIEKKFLSRVNQHIINAINISYPSIIVSINDSKNPFDYEELYGFASEKKNKKVRPNCVSIDSVNYNRRTEYFDKFQFTGIELDINEIPDIEYQFGYFLEFINALQGQDVIGYEDMKIVNEDSIRRHERYINNGEPDKRKIVLTVVYNEELNEYSNGLKVSEDPYLPKIYVIVLNKEATNRKEIYVKLSLERIEENVKNYIERRKKEDAENPGERLMETNSYNVRLTSRDK